MGTPTVEMHDDHLRVTLDPMASVVTLSGDIVVPYSTLDAVEVVPPAWPPPFTPWRVGVHVPGWVAKGRFGRSFRGPRRFLWMERGTTRVLRLGLRGHPVYEEVSLDLPDAEALRDAIAGRMPKR